MLPHPADFSHRPVIHNWALSVQDTRCDKVLSFAIAIQPSAWQHLLFLGEPFQYPSGILRLQALF